MATPELHDERTEQTPLPEGTVLGNFDDEPAATEQVEDTPEPTPAIPEKYQGKTSAELIAMHQEAERFNGKQSSEVGELRRSVDSLIQAQLAPAATSTVPVVEDEIDFFENPDEAIDRKIANHPSVKAAERAAKQYDKLTAEQTLAVKHPDMNTLVADEGFLAWVQASPVRTRLFRQAHSQYDYEAADELFSNWKERIELAQQTVALEKTERKNAIKAADTGNAPASAEGSPRKMYRRADIIRLMNDFPEKYLERADEIRIAYEEKRVIN
jgi:hypothetical protein